MEPVYSRDETVAAVRDYYAFLASMFMDPSYILEPPLGGWPSITSEAAKDLGKSDEVIDLLRHLPYVRRQPGLNLPEGTPGGRFIDWKYTVERLSDEDVWADVELIAAEGEEDQFGGKIPSGCIGLVHGGLLMGNELPDVILLDTKSGLIYWMNCPAKVLETASPQSSYFIDSLDGESPEHRDDDSASSRSSRSTLPLSPSASASSFSNHEEEDHEEEDEDGGEDEGGEEDEYEGIEWGPCWPVRQFFEMLKNQFRELNFIAKNEFNVIDIWTQTKEPYGPIPEDFTKSLQAVYREHGWPEVSRYRKADCLTELERVLDTKYPRHHNYYVRFLT